MQIIVEDYSILEHFQASSKEMHIVIMIEDIFLINQIRQYNWKLNKDFMLESNTGDFLKLNNIKKSDINKIKKSDSNILFSIIDSNNNLKFFSKIENDSYVETKTLKI